MELTEGSENLLLQQVSHFGSISTVIQSCKRPQESITCSTTITLRWFQQFHSTFPNSAEQILLAGKPGIERQGPFRCPKNSKAGFHQNQDLRVQDRKPGIGNQLGVVRSPAGLIFFRLPGSGRLITPTCRKCFFQRAWPILQLSFPPPRATLATACF